jgi:hypothetical protein
MRLHVRVVPILILIGLLHWALIILTNCTYNVPLALSTRYVLYLFNSLLSVQRSSPTFPRLQGLSMQPQNCVLDLIPLFPVDGAGWTY